MLTKNADMNKAVKHEADDFELFSKLDLSPANRRYLEMCLAACYAAGQKDTLESLQA